MSIDNRPCKIITHYGLVMPYDNIGLSQHWLRQWLGAWGNQAITWSNIDLSPVKFCSIHLRSLSHEDLKIPTSKTTLKSEFLKWYPDYPRVNELVLLSCLWCLRPSWMFAYNMSFHVLFMCEQFTADGTLESLLLEMHCFDVSPEIVFPRHDPVANMARQHLKHHNTWHSVQAGRWQFLGGHKFTVDNLTHLLLDKMAAISQMIFSDAFLWIKSLFTVVKVAITQHWFR